MAEVVAAVELICGTMVISEIFVYCPGLHLLVVLFVSQSVGEDKLFAIYPRCRKPWLQSRSLHWQVRNVLLRALSPQFYVVGVIIALL